MKRLGDITKINEGMAVWASEIEDFPIEVTRRRFPEVEDE